MVLIDKHHYSGTKSLGALESKSKRILALASRRILRSKDATALGLPRNYLSRLVENGLLRRVGHGLYISTSAVPPEDFSLLRVTARVPRGIICLLSALHFHGLTTKPPRQVWIAIAGKGSTPRMTSPATRFVRMSRPALGFGIGEYRVRGGRLTVYTPAKTVADCFKFRNKIGHDVALQALRDCRRLKRASIDDIRTAAKVCRVANVMRPYLESIW